MEVLTVDTVNRFQNRICIIEKQEKENEISCIIEEPKTDEAIVWIVNKFVQDNESLNFSM